MARGVRVIQARYFKWGGRQFGTLPLLKMAVLIQARQPVDEWDITRTSKEVIFFHRKSLRRVAFKFHMSNQVVTLSPAPYEGSFNGDKPST